jgi:hypothetical protein
MALLITLPFCLWLKRGTRTMPVMEAFMLAHLPGYLIPLLTVQHQLFEYSTAVLLKTAFLTCAYLFSVQIAGFGTTLYVGRGAPWGWLYLQRSLPRINKSGLMWAFLCIWSLYAVASHEQLLPNFGANANFVYSLTLVPGQLAIFYFFYHFGKGNLSTPQGLVLLGITVSMVALNWAAGLLIVGFSTLVLTIFAYSLGATRVPVLACTIGLMVVSFLQLGKSEMRDVYWQEGASRSIVDIYTYWIKASWNNLINTQPEGTESIAERGSVIRWLALVVDQTPGNKPYLNGET